MRFWSTQFSQKLSWGTAGLQCSENHLLYGLLLPSGHGPLIFWLKAWRVSISSWIKRSKPSLLGFQLHVSSDSGRCLVVRSMLSQQFFFVSQAHKTVRGFTLSFKIFRPSSPLPQSSGTREMFHGNPVVHLGPCESSSGHTSSVALLVSFPL